MSPFGQSSGRPRGQHGKHPILRAMHRRSSSYTKENLQKALHAVLSGQMTQFHAAKVFAVSQPTISRKVNQLRELAKSKNPEDRDKIDNV